MDKTQKDSARRALEAQVGALITALQGEDLYACTRKKGGQACTAQYEDQTDADGAPVLYFNTGCTVVARLCPACRAYWHVATARNALFDAARID